MSIISQAVARIGVGYGPQSVGRLGLFGQQTQQDGHSGYWKLFYMRMQEEELVERNRKVEAPVEVVAVKEKQLKVKSQPRRQVVVEREPEIIVPPFVPKEVSLPADTYVDTQMFINTLQPELVFQWTQYKLYAQLIIVEAQNDEDDDILLLLAA